MKRQINNRPEQNQPSLDQDRDKMIIPARVARAARFFSSPHGEKSGITAPPPSPR